MTWDSSSRLPGITRHKMFRRWYRGALLVTLRWLVTIVGKLLAPHHVRVSARYYWLTWAVGDEVRLSLTVRGQNENLESQGTDTYRGTQP
jgi:hypothetical protein